MWWVTAAIATLVMLVLVIVYLIVASIPEVEEDISTFDRRDGVGE